MSGCNLLGTKPIKSTDSYCDKHFALKRNEKIRQDIKKISPDFFEYVKVNETTFICDCPATKSSEEKEKCYADFLKLEKNKK